MYIRVSCANYLGTNALCFFASTLPFLCKSHQIPRGNTKKKYFWIWIWININICINVYTKPHKPIFFMHLFLHRSQWNSSCFHSHKRLKKELSKSHHSHRHHDPPPPPSPTPQAPSLSAPQCGAVLSFRNKVTPRWQLKFPELTEGRCHVAAHTADA